MPLGPHRATESKESNHNYPPGSNPFEASLAAQLVASDIPPPPAKLEETPSEPCPGPVKWGNYGHTSSGESGSDTDAKLGATTTSFVSLGQEVKKLEGRGHIFLAIDFSLSIG